MRVHADSAQGICVDHMSTRGWLVCSLLIGSSTHKQHTCTFYETYQSNPSFSYQDTLLNLTSTVCVQSQHIRRYNFPAGFSSAFSVKKKKEKKSSDWNFYTNLFLVGFLSYARC